MFSSNAAQFSAIWESHDCKPFFQISHRSIDSQAAESCVEFELNTYSPKIPNNLLHKNKVSLSRIPILTLSGVAEAQTLKLDFVVKKWREWKQLLGYNFRLI